MFLLDAEACGIGWKPFDKSCYKIHTLPMTWEESLAHCLSVNAHLVKVTSREEMDFIYFSFVKPLRSGSAWIGLNLQQGSFRWTDNTDLRYKNWNVGEPNNFKGYEHCVEIFVNNGKWNDIPCWLKRPFVCEKGMYCSLIRLGYLSQKIKRWSKYHRKFTPSVKMNELLISKNVLAFSDKPRQGPL